MSFQAIFNVVAAGTALMLGIGAVALDRRSAIRHVLFAGLFVLALENVFSAMSGMALLPERVMELQRARLVIAALLPAIWLLFSLTFARGNRLEGLRRWSPVLAIAVVIPVAAVSGWHGDLVMDAQVSAPDPGLWMTNLGVSGRALHVMLLLTGVLVLMNLERTFRGAVGTMRWRIKFMILGVGTIFAVRIHTSAQALLYSAVYSDADILNAAAVILGGLLVVRGLPRARSDRVDLYVSHAMLYRSATVLLSGLYLLFVGVLAGLFRRIGGIAHFPLLSLLLFAGIIGLSVLLASDRLRLFTKRFISLHFKKPQYDYRQVWARFAEATAGMMERDAYCRSVVRMVSETFEALSVTIWLTGPARDHLVFGASTSLAHKNATEDLPCAGSSGSAWIGEALRAMRLARRPCDLDGMPDGWAVAFREWNPSSFPGRGGHRVAMPLVGQDALTGIMVVGDRVGGVPFTPEELELIGVIGGQTGAGLLNADLSERLLQAREMEAFQTMSAFFVHDLKNTASTLSLMLDNLPRHFADPAFRDDALKAIASCAGRIDNLIRRLTALRHKLDVRPVKTDLNALVRHVHDILAGTLVPKPVLDLGDVPAVQVDVEQMEKVLTNLFLNAAEATGRSGVVRVETHTGGDAVVLTVSDNGCGMSRRFIEESLFRPFSSTKKDGLGIGLFQSRMIVEAHGGKIVVESEEGQGTSFHIRLPVE